VAVCPKEAVECGEFPLSEFPAITELKPLPTPAAARNLLMTRRSVREFKKERIPRELLEEIVGIASNSPTGHNAQAVRLSVITDKELLEELDARIMRTFKKIIKAASNPVSETVLKSVGADLFANMLADQKDAFERFEASEGDKKMHVFRGAPILVVAHYGTDSLSGKDDCVIALRDISLMAEAHGLGCTWIGYLVAAAHIDPSIKKKLGVPLGDIIAQAVILGRPRRKYKRAIPRKPINVKWIG
jgi:nitroreductase